MSERIERGERGDDFLGISIKFSVLLFTWQILFSWEIIIVIISSSDNLFSTFSIAALIIIGVFLRVVRL